MADKDPTITLHEFRQLLVSLLTNQKPAQVEFIGTQPVKLVRPACARDIVPYRPVTVDSQTIPKKILDANPARVTAVIRNLSTTDTIIVGGSDGNAPGLTSAGDPIGLPVKPGEALSLDMTGEVWAIMQNIACKVSPTEIVSQISQDSK